MIYLIRHAQDESVNDITINDPNLTEKGIKQSIQIASFLKDRNIEDIFASPIRRCKETAIIIAKELGKEVITKPNFREYDRALILGLSKEEAKQKYGIAYYADLGWNEPWPEGESPRDFAIRVRSAWFKFKNDNKGKNVLLVTHGGVINLILCEENKIPYSNKETKFEIENGQIIEIEN